MKQTVEVDFFADYSDILLYADESDGFPLVSKEAPSRDINLAEVLCPRFKQLQVVRAVFCLLLLKYGLFALIGPSTLVFYGLALLNGSKYTLEELRYLGISEVILGLVSMYFIASFTVLNSFSALIPPHAIMHVLLLVSPCIIMNCSCSVLFITCEELGLVTISCA